MIIGAAIARRLGTVVRRGTTGPAYPAFTGAVAFGLTVSMTVPFGSVLVLAVLLAPGRWRAVAICSSIGSSLGALVVYLIFHHLGWAQFVQAYPDVARSEAWQDATRWLAEYGSLALLAISAMPVPQTPALMFAGIYRMPVPEVWLAMFVGKIIKYGFYARVVALFPERFAWRYAALLAVAMPHAGSPAGGDGPPRKGRANGNR